MAKTQSQNKKVMELLRAGKTLTALDIFKKTGSLHSPRRILDCKEQLVKEKSPYQISDVWHEVKDKKSGKIIQRYKKYFLAYTN